jgi:hypothetical protein
VRHQLPGHHNDPHKCLGKPIGVLLDRQERSLGQAIQAAADLD